MIHQTYYKSNEACVKLYHILHTVYHQGKMEEDDWKAFPDSMDVQSYNHDTVIIYLLFVYDFSAGESWSSSIYGQDVNGNFVKYSIWLFYRMAIIDGLMTRPSAPPSIVRERNTLHASFIVANDVNYTQWAPTLPNRCSSRSLLTTIYAFTFVGNKVSCLRCAPAHWERSALIQSQTKIFFRHTLQHPRYWLVSWLPLRSFDGKGRNAQCSCLRWRRRKISFLWFFITALPLWIGAIAPDIMDAGPNYYTVECCAPEQFTEFALRPRILPPNLVWTTYTCLDKQVPNSILQKWPPNFRDVKIFVPILWFDQFIWSSSSAH